MKKFRCICGHRLFFENTFCSGCGSLLGYDPFRATIVACREKAPGEWIELRADDQAPYTYKPCLNYSMHGVCSWLVPSHHVSAYCLSCDLNQTIPALSDPKRRQWWSNMENAKRRLVVTLLKLGLPLENRKYSGAGLAFAFLEDKRINPYVEEEFVATGHADGLITVNLAESDDVKREETRVEMGERYRTLLGHFRHESGHYYFDRLITNSQLLPEFRELFGDEQQDYEKALKHYYASLATLPWQTGYISRYAQAHPLEDWAECWAHYLHMVDTLETAAEASIVRDHFASGDIEAWFADWTEVTVTMNALNRSMGLQDAYPFVLSQQTLRKLRFVHRVVNPRPGTS